MYQKGIVISGKQEEGGKYWDDKWISNVLHQRSQLMLVLKEMHPNSEKITDAEELLELMKSEATESNVCRIS